MERSIGWRFASLILLFSSVITLTFTAITLGRDVWDMNNEAVALQLQSILRLPDIEYLEVRGTNAAVLAQAGDHRAQRTLERDYPLRHNTWGEAHILGSLHVVATLDAVVQRLQDRVVVILLTQGVKTFIVSAFILVLFQWLVGHHLRTIAQYLVQWKPGQSGEKLPSDAPLKLERSHTDQQTDELAHVEQAINAMQQRLGQTLREIQTSQARLSSVVSNMVDGVILMDDQGIVQLMNAAAEHLFGYAAQEVVGKNVSMLMPQPDRDAHIPKIIGIGREVLGMHKDGTSFPMELSIGEIHDPQGHSFVGTVRDIAAKKAAERLIWKQANFDSVTDLPNRNMFYERLGQEIRTATHTGLPLALMFLDLDHFKEINDTLGHDVGDALLCEAARRLSSCVRASDSVARFGGDEFTVVLPALEDPSTIECVAQNILQQMRAVFALGQEAVYVSASIGITVYPGDATDINVLLKSADQAMYAAKSKGRNRYQFFTPSMQEATQSRMRLSHDLRLALDAGQLHMAYQPIVHLQSRQVHKAEALLRWIHPTLGRPPLIVHSGGRRLGPYQRSGRLDRAYQCCACRRLPRATGATISNQYQHIARAIPDRARPLPHLACYPGRPGPTRKRGVHRNHRRCADGDLCGSDRAIAAFT